MASLVENFIRRIEKLLTSRASVPLPGTNHVSDDWQNTDVYPGEFGADLTSGYLYTSDGEAIGHDFGAESKVEILWKKGNEHPQHGFATYLTAVKVSERTEGYKSADEETNEFFA